MMVLGLVLACLGAGGLSLFAWGALDEVRITDATVARLQGDLWQAQDDVVWWRDAAQGVK